MACTVQSEAQTPDNLGKLSASKLKAYAKAALEAGDVYSASAYYEQYCTKRPKDKKALFELAEAYRLSRNYQQAELYYGKAFEADEKANLMALFYQAQMQKMNGKYDEATTNFTKFRKKYKGFNDEQVVKRKVRIEIEGCERSAAIIDSALNVDIKHLAINKAHMELSPMPVNDSTLVYAALKADKSTFYATKDSAKWPVRQFYLANKKEEVWQDVGKWEEEPFNEEGVITANGAFSPDKERFYFTKCAHNYTGKFVCAIYCSQLVDDRWETPEILDENINDPNFSSTQPTFAIETFRNRTVMYFVSDREGGKGGLDIWYTVFNAKTATFSTAKPLSLKVNSKEDEMTPYYDQSSGALYFSSNGRVGLGGFDVFRAKGQMNKWDDHAENVGYPINSSVDDLYYVLNSDGESGYMVSNRPGGVALLNPTCCDDIYAFAPKEEEPEPKPEVPTEDSIVVDVPVIVKPPPPPKRTIILTGILWEEDDNGNKGQLIKGGLVTLYKVDNGRKVFVRSGISERNGSFSFKLDPNATYELRFSKENYFNNTASFSTVNLANDRPKRDYGLIPISEKPIIIENIYYEFDKDDLTPLAKQTIDTELYPLLLDNPAIIIEIRSHTDSKGKETYNQSLSQRRAQSVVNHLMAKGIDKNRLKASGYGETLPIAPNTFDNGEDNPDGRQKNRRTEFKVIGKLDYDIIYKE